MKIKEVRHLLVTQEDCVVIEQELKTIFGLRTEQEHIDMDMLYHYDEYEIETIRHGAYLFIKVKA